MLPKLVRLAISFRNETGDNNAPSPKLAPLPKARRINPSNLTVTSPDLANAGATTSIVEIIAPLAATAPDWTPLATFIPVEITVAATPLEKTPATAAKEANCSAIGNAAKASAIPIIATRTCPR